MLMDAAPRPFERTPDVCRDCGVALVAGENWAAREQKKHHKRCLEHARTYARAAARKYAMAQRTKKPEDDHPDDEPDEAEEEEEEKPVAEKAAPKLSDLDDRALLKKLQAYTEEFQIIASDQSQAAMTRRVQLVRLMRGVQDVRDAREPIIEVTVPRTVGGEPFQLGPRAFHPGVHRVRASIAQYLLWLISENQRLELALMNGREIDFGSPGSRARMAAIARDDGVDDYSWKTR
jgi:flagellar biosynthesis GTPase FlhF